MTQIIIQGPTYGSNQPVRLTVNGRSAEFPCNTPVELDDEQLDALRLTDHPFQILGDAAADEEAPAGSGDGGEVGGEPSGESSPPLPEAELPAGFMDRNVTSIIADLPILDTAQVELAHSLEDKGKARKSLLAAIDEELAKRAAPPAA